MYVHTRSVFTQRVKGGLWLVSNIPDSNSVSQPGSTINSLTENIPGVIYKIFYRRTVFRPSLDPSHQPRVTAPPGLAMTLIISNNTDLARMYIYLRAFFSTSYRLLVTTLVKLIARLSPNLSYWQVRGRVPVQSPKYPKVKSKEGEGNLASRLDFYILNYKSLCPYVSHIMSPCYF